MTKKPAHYESVGVEDGAGAILTCTLTHANMEWAGLMAYAAASHQGVMCWFCFW